MIFWHKIFSYYLDEFGRGVSYGDYPNDQGVQKILVVKLRHLGDVLLTTPVFSVLRRKWPLARIDAYVYEESREMLLGHPAVGKIWGYDRKWKRLGLLRRFVREVEMLRGIRKERYDLVINLTEGDRGAMATRVCGAGIRVGVDGRRIYTHVAKTCPTPRHAVERQLDVLRRIGIFPEEKERELFWDVSDCARKTMAKRVLWNDFILIHPVSRWRFKCWPEQKMRELIESLLSRGERVVVSSGPDRIEQEMVGRIVEGIDGVCNVSGTLQLKELGALIERAKVLLCVDSVPFHMASALKKPCVALFGPTSDVTWGPWRNPYAKVLTVPLSCRPCFLDGCGGGKKSDCLDAISVERVLSELELFSEIRASRLRIVDQLFNGAR